MNAICKITFKRVNLNMIEEFSMPEISIILPCRNEETALPFCLEKIQNIIKSNNLSAEIIVSDSSSDNSPVIAKSYNAILIKHNKVGYGNAYLEAFKFAKGKYIFMADADDTYDFNEIINFINALKNDSDFVIGNRFAYKIKKGVMPIERKLIGNPLLSLLLRILHKAKIKDSQCGMRAIKKTCLNNLHLKSTGMEMASEMIIKATKNNLIIKELPINYFIRKGKSKLKPVTDGLRHLFLIIKEKFV